MNDTELPLGQKTNYPTSFSRDFLVAIPRSDAREKLVEEGMNLDFKGYDLWTLYELSWLSSYGVPQVMIAEIRVPADSPNIVESKSLKLYINGLYHRRFRSAEEVRDEIAAALTRLLEASVIVHLWPLSDFGGAVEANRDYIDLDQLGIQAPDSPDTYRLTSERIPNYQRTYKTDLFRSLCPVTGQPDWASVYIALKGVKPDMQGLGAYLLGYREHQGFHENCVEQIYADITSMLDPDELTIAARFTRRGGIDINPYRTTSEALIPMPGRGLRQ